jgi:uncharacterized protein YukE
MKIFRIKTSVIYVSLALLTAGLAGCVSKSYDKGTVTATALQASADAVAQTSTRITDLLGALNNLTFKPQGDLRDQYDAFTGAAKKLDESTDKLNQTVTAMQLKAGAYLEDWSNQLSSIQSPDIRDLSAQRRNTVATDLANAVTSYQGVKNSLAPFTSDIRDIQTYLGTDLTMGGLDAIRSKVTQTKVDAVPLRDSVKKLQSDFNELSKALSPVLKSKNWLGM